MNTVTLIRLWARVRVVLTAAPTWLTMVATVLTIIAGAVGGTVAAALLGVAAALTSAILVIRRVTPVLPDERGILPKDAV